MLSAKLQMRQSQTLVMTPQLLQSIRLLQFSHLELQSFIDGEMEKNPLLVSEASSEAAGAQESAPSDSAAAEDFGSETSLSGERDDSTAYDDGFADVEPAAEVPGIAPSEDRAPLQPTGYDGPSGNGLGASVVESLAEGRPSLYAHALGEIAEAIGDPLERKIADSLVEHLDEAGYLRCDIGATAAALGIAPERLAAIVDRLQREAEPAGLFALDLADCLAIQLRRKDRLDPVMQQVLAHLDLLARRDFQALRRITGEDQNGLMDILAEIRRLDPKPGQYFEASPVDVVVPDVVVEEASDGSWRIELNPDALPKVLVQSDYVGRVAGGRLDKEGQSFLADCHASANWLVRSLDQRARTILKVASEIVRRQDGFLTEGITGLKPLTLMSVAEAVGMHESTISRVTANKYMATPRGTFELKFFFTVAIASSSGGDAHSAESVKHRIKTMVGAEGPGSVLSDDDIAERLKREGVDLARRTVAKYREGLGIPSSIQRRREFNARRLAS
jgi:RNA polymerase sigma-54 factor